MRRTVPPSRGHTVSVVLFLLFGMLALPAGAAWAVLPELPRVLIDTTYAPPSGAVISVPAGGDFQAALDSARPGDIIELAAGASYTGPFTLPNKTGAGWAYIRTSAHALLPPPGTRVTPAQASLMPKILGPAYSSAIIAANGAHHYRFVGVEVKPRPGTFLYNVIELGENADTDTQQPHDITFDRVWVHGDPTAGSRRCFSFHGEAMAIIDSYLSDCKESGADSQAIGSWNGSGPFKIVNNYLEGAGENILFGGADPNITNLVPSDIEIRGNHFFKPLSWQGSGWTIKNLLELKNARRVLITGNVFEDCWAQAQTGWAVLFTVRNQGGSAPWSDVSDVTFTNNIVRHVSSGVQMHGADDNYKSQVTRRILIQNNLFDDLDSGKWGGSGRLFQIRGVDAGGLSDVTITHNTGFHVENVIQAGIVPMYNFVFTNNIQRHNVYGVIGDGTNPGNDTLRTWFPGAVFSKNVLADGDSGIYPAGNYFPVSMSGVGFVDLAAGNYRLAATSPYKNAGTDGKALGADIDALDAATAGAVSGSTTDTGSAPSGSAGTGAATGTGTDTIPPTVSILSPASGATVAGVVPITASASDDVGVTRIDYLLDGGILAVTSPPATRFTWDTTTVTDGAHTLTVKAYDAAGNSGASAAVTVTVRNGSPAPTLGSLSPNSATAGGTAFALTGNGGNFVASSVVRWNGADRTTSYVSATQLRAAISAADIASAGTAQVTVYTPAPGGGTSAPLTFTISAPATTSSITGTTTGTTTGPTTSTTTSATTTGGVTSGGALSGVMVTSSLASPVSGAVTLTATIADTTGLTGVQFKLDGYVLDAKDTVAPYQITWSAASTANGTHTITAEAAYSDGRVLVSAPLPLAVANPETFNRLLYVDAGAGNDANSGLSPTSAWKTITKANSTVQPGDTVYLTGTFTGQRIQPAVSGSAPKPITYKSLPGTTAVLDGGLGEEGIWLQGVNYIVIDGLKVINGTSSWFDWIDGGDHNVIRNGTFDKAAIYIVGSDNVVEHNTITNVGDKYAQTGDSISIHAWAPGQGNRNKILHNTIINGGHALIGIGYSSDTQDLLDNVIAHNILSNPWENTIGLQYRSRRTLVEYNRITDADAVDYPRSGMNVMSSENIIRFNEFYNNKRYGIELNTWGGQVASRNQIYHNVFYGNALAGLFIYDATGSRVQDNLIANNIFFKNGGFSSDGRLYTININLYDSPSGWPAGSLNGNKIQNNVVLRQSGSAGEQSVLFIRNTASGGDLSLTVAQFQSRFADARNNLEVDPLFVDETVRDFYLQPGSPAVDKGMVIAGMTYGGAAPDIGAYELGASATTPGTTTPTSTTSPTTTTPTTSTTSSTAGTTTSTTSTTSSTGSAGAGASAPTSSSTTTTATPSNPAPTLSSLSPSSATAGGVAFTLTVNGGNFVASSVVRWNGADRTTTYVSATQLRAAIATGDVAAAGTAQVTVYTPAPGGGTSAAKTFTISAPTTAGGASTGTALSSSVTLVAPSGTLTTNKPTYVWKPMAGAVRYRVWVDDSTGRQVLRRYMAAEAGCASGAGNCSVRPDVPLAPGAGKWRVSGETATTTLAWSSYMTFTVPGGTTAGTTPSTTPACPCTIWSSTAMPKLVTDPDPNPVELGVKFRADVDGWIIALLFYKSPSNTGPHVANLWTRTGTLLASVTVTDETASGWQQVTLPAPVRITANTTYVASYHTTVGHYSVDEPYFPGLAVVKSPLRALADGEDGPNGVYKYGPSGFPTSTYNSSNYWVDVVFMPK